MKIIRFTNVDEVPASHEDVRDPGVMKKILLRRQDLFEGCIQMVNWAVLLPGKTFSKHFHEDMQEVFIMIGDGVEARIDGNKVLLNRGDALIVDVGEQHEMKNSGITPLEYIVIGIAGEKKGRSINV